MTPNGNLAVQAGVIRAELMRRIGHSSPCAAALQQHARLDRDTDLTHTFNTLATGNLRHNLHRCYDARTPPRAGLG